MKKYKLLMALFALFFVATMSFASVGVRDDGTRVGIATDINFVNLTATRSGSVINVTQQGTVKHIELDMRSWGNVAYEGNSKMPVTNDYLLTTAHLDTGTYIASPYYYFTDTYADRIVFVGSRSTSDEGSAVQNGSPAEYTFRVPDAFSTTPTFTLMAKNSHIEHGGGLENAALATPNRIDWDVVINRAGNAESSTRYDLDSVALTATTDMQDVTLTYATPSDFVAGDVVTMRYWREFGAKGTALTHPTADTTYFADATSDLYVFNVVFDFVFSW